MTRRQVKMNRKTHSLVQYEREQQTRVINTFDVRTQENIVIRWDKTNRFMALFVVVERCQMFQ
jgi:hypothetical protein